MTYPFKAPGFEEKAHLYAVTNSHVALRDGRTRAIRISKIGGGTEIVLIPSDHWIHHDDSDIAAVPLDLDQGALRLADIPIEIFVTREDIETRIYTEGDDCLFIGRHYGLDGIERNTPAVRMGSVAIMQPEPVKRDLPYGRSEESIAVEPRSLSGFSGSPVFIWQSAPISAPVYEDKLRSGEHSLIGKWPVVVHSNTESRFAFLGITWGHMKGPNAVFDPGSSPEESEKALTLNSGIMLVGPAWRIRERLDSEELAAIRDEAEKQEIAEAAERASRSLAVSDSSEAPDDDKRVSLHPLSPEAPLRAMLGTPPLSMDGD